uniref:Uncharacterized protein n=1 Tax=Anguilla anguilla TaxID=7936 RepID=A0A0E9TWA9_ANGAN
MHRHPLPYSVSSSERAGGCFYSICTICAKLGPNLIFCRNTEMISF